MYIPEFLCGIIATVGAEFIAIIIYSIYLNVKNRGGKNNG